MLLILVAGLPYIAVAPVTNLPRREQCQMFALQGPMSEDDRPAVVETLVRGLDVNTGQDCCGSPRIESWPSLKKSSVDLFGSNDNFSFAGDGFSLSIQSSKPAYTEYMRYQQLSASPRCSHQFDFFPVPSIAACTSKMCVFLRWYTMLAVCLRNAQGVWQSVSILPTWNPIPANNYFNSERLFAVWSDLLGSNLTLMSTQCFV